MRLGDAVLCRSGEQQLVQIEHFPTDSETVQEITFRPDLAVEALAGRDAILTKGHKTREARRGGKAKQRSDEQMSIPATLDSWE